MEDEAAGLFGLESLDDHVLYAKEGHVMPAMPTQPSAAAAACASLCLWYLRLSLS